MADYFFDSSAMVKRFIVEAGTKWTISLMRPSAKNEIAVSQISGVEIVAAITRRQRGNVLTANQANKAINRFLRDFYNRFGVIKLDDAIVRNAIHLAQVHALRGYDVVQLSSALELKVKLTKLGLPSFIFVSADLNLNSAAQTEGLAIENPNNYP
jgi:hypothetical protein